MTETLIALYCLYAIGQAILVARSMEVDKESVSLFVLFMTFIAPVMTVSLLLIALHRILIFLTHYKRK